ncbi:MAG: dTDP-4-dehydrorhamnose 3,5-epimerase [Zetaproteobacteria bacterium CG_4_9_14_3_um_filter_49_83]|nr:MAG: dTDP-4-dehydrorhamnose 3,5-epimerase [Zetaproteobacteria bacterium CG1_02_49_23]PIQ32413.1 MAG: dTDP-4-dehydrorhamnose 3,5-epimerase [Zetaproteobacteria bacterium CG17_big_fil_post_rev_8_21_14_2_50_50_13]PIV30854.1 MAG: dTDP-4-dehydrorhamnose 3,5-epimerase [Zetaproteobacteria bacterium CG02_land_8_20_14_3_00_50_9]PIY56246.1 MAG: dTDP-4-dehydrorhamnose 3,5-epimerase [Zetaproteobacteria bacterium CG_4_10_14_0_8_um_filter_49_80]PJA34729.1 MAG: dTDP-4-dehydrorhamnose 3,5-epimerase [Zetaprot
MNIIETKLPGVLIVEPKVFGDARGFFLETFHKQRYQEAGIPGEGLEFVQDNHSRSSKGVLRGLHFQLENPQGKLVSAGTGVVFDVAADVNPDSSTYGQWVGVELSEENHRQLWIPPGYAHGFCVLSDVADFQYKCTALYHPASDSGVLWNDPDLDIQWPIEAPLLSDKDRALPALAAAARDRLPR